MKTGVVFAKQQYFILRCKTDSTRTNIFFTRAYEIRKCSTEIDCENFLIFLSSGLLVRKWFRRHAAMTHSLFVYWSTCRISSIFFWWLSKQIFVRKKQVWFRATLEQCVLKRSGKSFAVSDKCTRLRRLLHNVRKDNFSTVNCMRECFLLPFYWTTRFRGQLCPRIVYLKRFKIDDDLFARS